ncbi:polysaccharide lyase family protein [Mucilaginibacter terrae]|uniref:Rhamnogalacturonan endolyase n=1 Tax=Mucilaginibacter terrae TaxID=1955052 RepID=A0ABU3GTW7_9SPHI|nr:polysaccharide lyase family protein [Mucilaginibacter terrae]MDT3403212.1 rhamnogalacturonan endolyase [Mucilaginibacter terrae]
MRNKYLFVLLAAGIVLSSFMVKPKPKAVLAPAAPNVTVTDDGPTYTLANGYITIKVNKRTGDLTSVKTPKTVTPNVELMGYKSGHHAGYWEQSPALAAREVTAITIDPAKVNGDRGEVSIKGYSDGKSILGANPTAAGQGGGLIADLEIRYTLERGAHGLYTYAIFTHQDTYPAGSVGESRFGAKLSGMVFDWLSIDEKRNAMMPTGKDWDEGDDLNMKEARRLTTGVHKGRAEHKYDYSARQSAIPAFGWSSTKEKVGFYLINPSFEYLSSGPRHYELTGHLDDGDGGDPTILDYWRGTHYGGSMLPFADKEPWTKVVGPIFIYVPTGNTPQALFEDAKKQAKIEQARWPYNWVKDVDYTPATERATVKGKMKLVDAQAPSLKFTNLLVGLAHPDEPEPPRRPRPERPPVETAAPVTVAPVTPPAPADTPKLLANGKRANRGTYLPPRQAGARPAFNFPPQAMNWQNDAKYYQFWAEGAADGSFSITNVRPGIYQLHAIADGVLGAYDATATVTIMPSQKLDLGTIEWKPVRYGQQIFEIGIPNRSASEFFKGDDHWHWGMYIEYAKYFPNDVNFTVGKSNPAKDWYIYHVPHDTDFKPTGQDQGRATPWTINFTMPENAPASGKATLRFGIAGSGARSLGIAVNGKDLGPFTDIGGGGANMVRDGIEGTWVERKFNFDASLLKPGQNSIVLTVPAGNVTSGICYDVIRLEVEK